jgi:hypothetical protein
MNTDFFSVFNESLLITATSSGTAQTLYTCPPNTVAEVAAFFLANSSNGNVDVTVQLYHSDDDTTHIMFGASRVAGHSTVYPFNGQDFFLKAGDKLKVFDSSGAAVHATVSIKQFSKKIGL